MKVISILYVAICYVVVHGESDQKKTNQRDVNDAEINTDYSLAKIPVYVIPNSAPTADGKVPVAVIPNAYPAAYLSNGGGGGAGKDKPFKYGFYAPFKTSKVTPIHEPQNEGFVPLSLPTETPLAYSPQDLYQRPEYDSQQSAYKLSVSNGAYIKYEQPKALLTKQQSLSNSNVYASLAPAVYTYPNNAVGQPQPQQPQQPQQSQQQQQQQHSINYPAPLPKKYTTYDPENNVQIQYVIKYVPVPYTVPSVPDQYQHAAPEAAYIAHKPTYVYKQEQSAKKPAPAVLNVAQNSQSVNAGHYASSTENYAEYAKYAESYTPTVAEEQSQYSPLIKQYSFQPANYKYSYDKTAALAKKYTPVSYVLATIGKATPTHYTLRHDNPEQDPYATKLAPVPLSVDKYTGQESFKPSPSADDTKTYSESEYSQYSLPGGGAVKYKSSLVSPALPQFYNFEHGSPFQYQSSGYQKKDVSASISSARSTESSTEKQS